MKKYLVSLLILAFAFTFTACSSDDAAEDKLPVTLQEIQREWADIQYGDFYTLRFNDNKYSILIMDIKGNEIVSSEHGTFSINGLKINMTKNNGEKSQCDGGDIYWDSKFKNTLHLWPLGTFQKLRE